MLGRFPEIELRFSYTIKANWGSGRIFNYNNAQLRVI